MSQPKVVIYTQQDCPPCTWVKKFFALRGMEYEERGVDSGLAVARELAQKYNTQSTPTVVIGDQVLIGYDPDRLSQLLG